MGWNQRHYEDYKILIPMTLHGSKSKLRRSRYHKNRDNALIDAPLTSKSHNFWSNHWIFNIHTFLETWSQDLSKGVKINPIGGLLKVVALQGPLPRNLWRGYKKPQAPFRLGGDHFLLGFTLCLFFYTFYPLPNTKNHTKNTQKHFKASWFFSFHQKHKVLFLYPFFFSLVLHFGFGV